MAFGRKNKKVEAGAPPEQVEKTTSEESTPVAARRKTNETLASVVNESSPGAAVDLLRQNTAFALPGGKAWLALLLSTNDIGGLSVKQKGDEAKGSIIELIKADKIEAVVTADMLDEDFLGIVPTPGTLTRMNEFSLLTDARYYWIVFESDQNGSTLLAHPVDGAEASYAEALAISNGTSSVAKVLPQAWTYYGGVLDGEDSTQDQAPAAPAAPGAASAAILAPVAASAVDENPLSAALPFAGDSNSDDVDYTALDQDDESENEDSVDEADDQYAYENLDATDAASESYDEDEELAGFEEGSDEEFEQDTSYQDYLDANMGREVTEEEVRNTVARRFLTGDLDLVVDLEDFERAFVADNTPISIEVAEDPSDWLGSQVAQLTRQANADLSSLRQANTQDLRQLFVEAMSLHAERTVAEVSTEQSGTLYHSLMEAAKGDFENRCSNSQRELSETRSDIQRRFDEAADTRAEQAAAHARAQYSDKNRPKLERDMSDAQVDLDRRHEEQFAHDRMTVLETRKKDAQVRMDIGLTRVFQLLRERQEEQRNGERELFNEWNNELTRFIDENRKNDVARADALAEQLARANAVEELKQEHAARVEELRAEQADRERRAEEDLVRVRQEALDQLNARNSEYSGSLALEQERTRSQRTLAEELTRQIQLLGDEIEGQYKGRISTLESDKASYAEQLEQSNKTQRRANHTVVVLIVVLVLASLAVGVLLGQWWGVSQGNSGGMMLLGGYLAPDALSGGATATAML